MKNTARAYLIERVIPTYKTFIDYYNDRECGFKKDTFNAGNCAESLLNIPEHIFVEIGNITGYKTAGKFREAVSNNNNYYKIVCDFANVIKHRKIDRYKPTFSNLDNVKESIASVRYDDILGKYYKTRKLLEVNLSDGTVYEVSDLLHKSVLLWSNQLLTLGLIPEMPKLPELLPKFIKRNDNRFDGKIIILGSVGEYMEEHLRALVYRREKDIITEPTPRRKFGKALIPLIMNIGHSPFLEDNNKKPR